MLMANTQPPPTLKPSGGQVLPVFVTGATSPLGLRVVRLLSEEGWGPCCLLRSAWHERELFSVGMSAVVRGDCRHPEAWESAFEGMGLLLHLAPIALAGPVVQAASRRGVSRCIAISSTRGLSRLPDPIADGVLRGEAAVEASGLDYTLLRCAMMYGSRRDANIQRVVDWLDRHTWVPLLDGGEARIQPVHVDDVAGAVLRAIRNPARTRRTRLTIAGPEPVSWREMVETLAAVRGRPVRCLSLPLRPALTVARLLGRFSDRATALSGIIERLGENRVYDISESRLALDDWQPLNLREGLERTYAPAV